MSGRVCSKCPRILTDGSTICVWCKREKDRARGTSTQRGYGSAHQTERARWQAKIDAGEEVACTRCWRQILPGTPWDLGHSDSRTFYTGPEHATCNRSAAGKHAAALRNR
ncbi:hypothetical protein [Timonella senegalensis]|uniref:hypothetical protein n=1 Tax=Timonella senegalensis TaxID=1465825 RepID=UPI0028B11891|nr:hypothetical protein [Timonella senegalensis]